MDRNAPRRGGGSEPGGQEDAAPFRAPPCPDYVFFCETARSVAVCIELNAAEGLFAVAADPRLSSLAVIEAVAEDGNPCEVRLIGRVTERLNKPSKLVRVKWMRAVSPLPPERLKQMVEQYYGFVIEMDCAALDPAEFRLGAEYDFSRGIMNPRIIDSARGDTCRYKRAAPQTPPQRRFQGPGRTEVGEQMGLGVTQTIRVLRPDSTKDTPDKG